MTTVVATVAITGLVLVAVLAREAIRSARAASRRAFAIGKLTFLWTAAAGACVTLAASDVHLELEALVQVGLGFAWAAAGGIAVYAAMTLRGHRP